MGDHFCGADGLLEGEVGSEVIGLVLRMCYVCVCWEGGTLYTALLWLGECYVCSRAMCYIWGRINLL